jgi:hypothetical protein
MSNAPTTSLPPGQANKLAVLIDSPDGVVISSAERSSLTWWWAGSEAATVASASLPSAALTVTHAPSTAARLRRPAPARRTRLAHAPDHVSDGFPSSTLVRYRKAGSSPLSGSASRVVQPGGQTLHGSAAEATRARPKEAPSVNWALVKKA